MSYYLSYEYIYRHLHIAPRVLLCVVEELEYSIFHCTHLNKLIYQQYHTSIHQVIYGTPIVTTNNTPKSVYSSALPPHLHTIVTQDMKQELADMLRYQLVENKNNNTKRRKVVKP